MLNLSALALVMQLGATTSIEVTIQAEPGFQGTVDLKVDTSALTQDQDHDVTFTITPARLTLAGGSGQAKLTVKTKTSAPSFAGGKFALVAKAGGAEQRAQVALDVKAIYTVNVTQKTEGKCAGNRDIQERDVVAGRASWICDFDSSAETSYFRKHAAGLQVIFHNATSDTFYIHGSDAIEHMHFDVPQLAPGKDYLNPVIKGGRDDPSNLKGSYTLHEIYRPSRNVVFNAETIPAALPR